jgi:hypothetical protein
MANTTILHGWNRASLGNQNTSFGFGLYSQCICFSLDKKSPFIKKFKRFDISLKMKKMGDGCEEVKMAQFWDCNHMFQLTKVI